MYRHTAGNRQDIVQRQSQNDVNELINKNYVFDPQMLSDLHKKLWDASNNSSSDPAVALYYYFAFDALRNYFNQLMNEKKLTPEFESAFHNISALTPPNFVTIQSRFIQSYLTRDPVISGLKKLSYILEKYNPAKYRRNSIPTSSFANMSTVYPVMTESPFQSQYAPSMVSPSPYENPSIPPSPSSFVNSSLSQPTARRVSGPGAFSASMVVPTQHKPQGSNFYSYPGSSPTTYGNSSQYGLYTTSIIGTSSSMQSPAPSLQRIPSLPRDSIYNSIQPPLVACGDLLSSGYISPRNSGEMPGSLLLNKYNLDEIPEYAELKLGYFNPSSLLKMEMKAQ